MIVVKQLISDTGIVYGTIEYDDSLKKSDAKTPRSEKRKN